MNQLDPKQIKPYCFIIGIMMIVVGSAVFCWGIVNLPRVVFP